MLLPSSSAAVALWVAAACCAHGRAAPMAQSLNDHLAQHADCAAQVPGSAFDVGLCSTKPLDFRPGGGDARELESYKIRQQWVEADDMRRRALRRDGLEPTCDGDRCFVPGLQVSVLFGEGMSFCVDCMDALETGSFVDTWESHYGPVRFHVDGRLVPVVPNDAAEPIINTKQVAGQVALVWRCTGVSLLRKVIRAQDAGARAVVIVDRNETDGGCMREFDCGPFLGRRPQNRLGTGFAATDLQSAWRLVHIPAVLIHSSDGNRLLQLMRLRTLELPGMGTHVMALDAF